MLQLELMLGTIVVPTTDVAAVATAKVLQASVVLLLRRLSVIAPAREFSVLV